MKEPNKHNSDGQRRNGTPRTDVLKSYFSLENKLNIHTEAKATAKGLKNNLKDLQTDPTHPLSPTNIKHTLIDTKSYKDCNNRPWELGQIFSKDPQVFWVFLGFLAVKVKSEQI